MRDRGFRRLAGLRALRIYANFLFGLAIFVLRGKDNLMIRRVALRKGVLVALLSCMVAFTTAGCSSSGSASAPTPTGGSSTSGGNATTSDSSTGCVDTTYSEENGYAVFRLCDVAATDRAHELGGDGDGFNRDFFPMPYVGELSFKAKGMDRAYLLEDPPFHLIHFHFSGIKGSTTSESQIAGMLWENSGSYGGALLHVVDTMPTKNGSICFNHPQSGQFMCEALFVYGPVSWDPNVTYSVNCTWDTESYLTCVIKDENGAVVFDKTADFNGGTIAEMSLLKVGNQAKDADKGGQMPSVKVTELEYKVKM